MNFQETIELIKELRRSGADHFKSNDFEVTFRSMPIVSRGTIAPEPAPVFTAPVVTPAVENVDATDKIKDLIETLKMDDSQLLDKIFPAGAGG